MSLVRWFRRNNKKVMAVVVIVIMFGFIGGSTLLQQLGRRSSIQAVAYFADNRKITNYDLSLERRELDILRAMGADVLLRNQNLSGLLLGQLLFTEQRTSPLIVNSVKQLIRTRRYRIGDKQINDIYRRSVPASVYWLLLKNEARLAGLKVPNEKAGELLAAVIPQLFNGMTYSQRMMALMNQNGLPEQELLGVFSQLLAVLQYAEMICSIEDVTSNQISQIVAMERENISADVVQLSSAIFAEGQSEPGEEQILEHFNKYKDFMAGEVSEKNPYGFGYKLPERVQLEYMVVKLDDVAPLVKKPTDQEMEDYYNNNIDEFTEMVLADPNDPNSQTQQTKSYAEVMDTISEKLTKNKINSTANMILQDARTMTEFNLAEMEPSDVTTEQLKKLIGDYRTNGRRLSIKHKVKLYTGQTGLLSPADMQKDEYLARLYLEGSGFNLASLPQVVFAVDEVGTSELGLFDVSKPRMYENIGPLKDMWAAEWSGRRDSSGHIMAIVRVINAVKATAPESVDYTYSKSSLELEPEQQDAEQDTYSVKEKVVEDLKKLAAMDTTEERAKELLDSVRKNGWDEALKRFNKRYIKEDKAEDAEDEIGPLEMRNLMGLRRMSAATLRTISIQNQSNPMAQTFLNERKNYNRLVEKLYSLVPSDSNTADAVPLVIEFKPDMSFYCVKNVSVRRLTLEEYRAVKAAHLKDEGEIQTNSLVAVHFNPENILKRMNFRAVQADENTADANTPTKSEAAL